MYTYDSGGRLSSKTAGKNGAGMTREVYAYDGLNRMTSRTVHEYSGRQLYIETYAYACVYDSTQGKYHEVVTKSTTASDGTETADVKTYNNEYGETERIETISGDMVLTAENTYDNQGHLIKTVDANGNAATYEYTYDGQVSKVTNADSGTVTTQYDLTGRAVSVTDANGNTAVTDYDKLGRAVKVTAPFDGTRNAVTKTYYDKNSNVVKKAVRENDTTYQTEEYRYDNMGNLTAASAGDEGEKSVTQYEYDSANRMTKMITGLAEISATPAGGNVTTYEYGADGFMLYRTDPMGNKEQGYEYDSYGNIMQRSDRNGNVFDYTYGAYGVKQERSIVGETKTNIYNSLGQITGTIDDYRNEKVEESYTYDAFGRMSSMTSADGTVQNYTYDSNSNVTAYSMTKDGTVRDRVSYEYDNMNRLTKLENDDIMFVYAYDLNGNLRNVMDGKSTRVDTLIAYNKANLPTIYRIRYNGTKNDYAMSYYLTGQKYREEDRTNNTLKEYYYNSKGQLNIEQAQRDNNYTIGAEYSYDAGGNRIQKKEHYLETYSTDVTNYTYDANNRLTQTAVIRGIAIGGDDTAGEVAELTRYYYDDNGNTIAEQNKTYTSDGEQSSGMQLSGRASGNSFKLYTYDDFNRLRQYNDGSTEAKYAYNASNLRTSKTVNRKKTDFVWNGQNLASETTNDVTTVYDYDLTGIIASTVNGEVTKYVKDPHGNVVVTSRNGSIAGEYDYSAFGEQLTATDTTNPFRYCGEYYDNENGLTYLRNRYYDSDTGRFLSEDPIKDGMNWYSYCGGDPVNAWDPMGLAFELPDYVKGDIRLSYIQGLTDDIIDYDNDKKEIVIIKYNDNAEKPSSTALVRKLIDDPTKCIVELDEGSNHFTTAPQKHPYTNELQYILIQIDPNMQHSFLVENPNGGNNILEEFDPYINMGHELVHVDNIVSGTFEEDKKKTGVYYYEDFGRWRSREESIEELNTTGILYYTFWTDSRGVQHVNSHQPQQYTENSIREEQGKTKRVKY